MLMTDSPQASGQKTPERGNSRLSTSAEAHSSLLHEPGSPGTHLQASQDPLCLCPIQQDAKFVELDTSLKGAKY